MISSTSVESLTMHKIHYTRFPVTDGEVANLLPTSRCNGIWETTGHNRHNGLLSAPTCYGLVVYVVDLLQT